jgi:hypothetical protein
MPSDLFRDFGGKTHGSMVHLAPLKAACKNHPAKRSKPMLRITLLLFLATTAFAADTCQSAKQALDDFLHTLPTACTTDSDCTGRYFGADACEPPVVTNKEKFTDSHHLFLLQKSARVACGTQDEPRPACSPIPFRATCKQNKCVDTLKEDIAALPKGPYHFGTINHSCGPADGPALDIRLTRSKDDRVPFINLNIYGNLPALPLSAARTYELKTGNDAGASRCTTEGHCVAADSGAFTLTRLDGTGGTGHYKVHLTDGTSEEGDFQLRWIEVKMVCD